MTNVFVQKLAAKGIAINGAAKMPVKTAKAAMTLVKAKDAILQNLEANKAYWLGKAAELSVKQRNYKFVNGVYAIGVKYTIRYLHNIFGEGVTVSKHDNKDEFIAMYDTLIAGVKDGDLDEQILDGIAANANMRRTTH